MKRRPLVLTLFSFPSLSPSADSLESTARPDTHDSRVHLTAFFPSLREKVVKIGAKVVAHGCYLVFQMAEVAVPPELFRRILDRIDRLRAPTLVRC